MRNHVALAWLLMLGLANMASAAPADAEQAGRRLSLEEAKAIALARSPDIAEAESRLAEAEARLRTAQAGSRPTLGVRGSADIWTEDQRLRPATRNAEAGAFGSELFGGEIMARWPIYTGGRVAGETDAATWMRQSVADRLARIRETLLFRITALYYDLLARQRYLVSLESAVRANDEHQRVVQALADADKAARVDVLRIQVRRAELYERLVRERNRLSLQQRGWAALLGLDDSAAPQAQGDLTPLNESICDDISACLDHASTRRADLAAARASVAAAQASVRAAGAGRRPSLSAQASYGLRWLPDPASDPDGADNPATLGRVGLVLEWPLFDGRLTDAREAEQRARMRGEQARLRMLELRIRYETETARSDIAAARERMDVFEQAVDQATESFRIVKDKYDLGKGALADVLDAQTALVAAQTGQAQAWSDLAIAYASRKLAIGELKP